MTLSKRRQPDKRIVNNYALSHAKGIQYYVLKEMQRSVKRAQKLWKRQLPMYDTLYFLNVISYGDLQKNYKDTSNELT
jgi:hypothetical protein